MDISAPLKDLLNHWILSRKHVDDRSIKKVLDFNGLKICVEIQKGESKVSKPATSEEWARTMRCDYGYFDQIYGNDGEYLDVYIGRHYKTEKRMFLITQLSKDGTVYDEDKVVIGCKSAFDATKLYLEHCNNPLCFGGIKEIYIDELQDRL